MRVLVIHGLRFDSRLTTYQHTLCFARHLQGCEVTYVSGFGLVNHQALEQSFDVVVITYELVALRNTPFWKYIAERIAPLLRRGKIRVVMPQDDYSSCAILDDFIVKNEIQYVFSPLTKDLQMLYPQSLSVGVQFHEAFTGYWESSTALPFIEYRTPFKMRSRDLGQRVRHLPPQLGAHAQKKGELAIQFADKAEKQGFKCDVSTRDKDVLIGIEWWKFLGDIRFTVGRLGGASVADPYGRLASKVNQLQLRRPSITYDQIARKLKTEQLPQGDFSAISPRLFECAAMGVCQILELDEYFDGFEPWAHYIPLESNLSNFLQVVDAMRDLDQCEEIALRAEEHLILSNRYTYDVFVTHLVKVVTGHDPLTSSSPLITIDVDEELFGDLDDSESERVKATARRSIIARPMKTDSELGTLAKKWKTHFKNGELSIESMTLPWSPALRFLSNT